MNQTRSLLLLSVLLHLTSCGGVNCPPNTSLQNPANTQPNNLHHPIVTKSPVPAPPEKCEWVFVEAAGGFTGERVKAFLGIDGKISEDVGYDGVTIKDSILYYFKDGSIRFSAKVIRKSHDSNHDSYTFEKEDGESRQFINVEETSLTIGDNLCDGYIYYFTKAK